MTILAGFAAAISIDLSQRSDSDHRKKEDFYVVADVLTSVDLSILGYCEDYRALPC
jgi:hypothetical protein